MCIPILKGMVNIELLCYCYFDHSSSSSPLLFEEVTGSDDNSTSVKPTTDSGGGGSTQAMDAIISRIKDRKVRFGFFFLLLPSFRPCFLSFFLSFFFFFLFAFFSISCVPTPCTHALPYTPTSRTLVQIILSSSSSSSSPSAASTGSTGRNESVPQYLVGCHDGFESIACGHSLLQLLHPTTWFIPGHPVLCLGC